MNDYQQSINRQYGHADISSRVLTALQNAGKNINALTRDDLLTFDELHIGGVAETRHLAQLVGLQPGMRVLDVGSGIGGPARTLAAEFGALVTGLDITEAFCRTAEILTERVGLSDRITFRQGSALDMPFEDNSFDVVWTQFAVMNIDDKSRLYDEMKRVLKPGGRLALHQIMAGAQGDLHFPVLWADEPSVSFLWPPEKIRELLRDKGFQEIVWKDLTVQSAEWFREMIARIQKSGPPKLGFHIIAENVPQKAANIVRNFDEDRIRAIQAVFAVNK